ncbi:hypothetical protein GCM10020229_21040 [Kitasatospora albolonga]
MFPDWVTPVAFPAVTAAAEETGPATESTAPSIAAANPAANGRFLPHRSNQRAVLRRMRRPSRGDGRSPDRGLRTA